MYVPWPSNPFVRRLERVGYALRKRLSLSDVEPLEPTKLIATYPNMVLFNIAPELDKSPTALKLLTEHSSKWSALAYRENGGPWLITWNPFHAEVRVRASLLEEVAHIILQHKPTKLIPDSITGLPRRTFTPSKEKEAYGVAGATLLPFNGLAKLLKQGHSATEIAHHFHVSEQLVQYRINVTRAAAQYVDGFRLAVVKRLKCLALTIAPCRGALATEAAAVEVVEKVQIALGIPDLDGYKVSRDRLPDLLDGQV